jgi:mRNA-degrading endonuclease toxin of MazEF toxin-antitoxin module
MIYEYFIRLLEWCKVNVLLIENKRSTYFKEGEVWWCSVGLNIGEEEFGKGPTFRRPVLIFKKFSKNSFLGLPLTGREKKGSWYVPCVVGGKIGSVMLNQARIFDGKRLESRIVEMKNDDFEIIKVRFRELYCPIKFVTPPLEGEAGISGKSQIVP